MRKILAAASILVALGLPAMAAEDFGPVQSINIEAKTIVVNGETYTLNEEFDSSTLERGTDVVISYEEDEGKRIVQDIVIDGEEPGEE